LPESLVAAPGKEFASTKIAYDTVLLERSPHASIHADGNTGKIGKAKSSV